MTSYEQGFLAACHKHGVDPYRLALAKTAADMAISKPSLTDRITNYVWNIKAEDMYREAKRRADVRKRWRTTSEKVNRYGQLHPNVYTPAISPILQAAANRGASNPNIEF